MQEEKSESIFRVLLVGRIYEEDEIFRIIKNAVVEFAKLTPALFYFMDKQTKEKINLILPKERC